MRERASEGGCHWIVKRLSEPVQFTCTQHIYPWGGTIYLSIYQCMIILISVGHPSIVITERARPALSWHVKIEPQLYNLRIPVYLPRAVGGPSFSCEQQFMHLVVHLHPLVLWFNRWLVVLMQVIDWWMCVCMGHRSIDRGTDCGDKFTICVMFCGVLFLLLFPGQTNFTASHTEETQNYWQSVNSQFLMIAMSDQIAVQVAVYVVHPQR